MSTIYHLASCRVDDITSTFHFLPKNGHHKRHTAPLRLFDGYHISPTFLLYYFASLHRVDLVVGDQLQHQALPFESKYPFTLMKGLSSNQITCDVIVERSCTVPIEEMDKVQIRTESSPTSINPGNENTLIFVKGLACSSEKEPTIQTQEETTSDTQFRSCDIMCPPKELCVPVYIPTHPVKSGDDNGSSDDDGSVSSLDSFEKEEFPMTPSLQSKRPIFAKYWKANDVHTETNDDAECIMKKSSLVAKDCRTASYTLSRCAREATIFLPDEFAYQEFNRDFTRYNTNSANDIYEDILKTNELGRTTMPNATSLKEVENDDEKGPLTAPVSTELLSDSVKSNTSSLTNLNTRTIFSNKYSKSTPSLVSYGYRERTNNPVRKTSSASSLRKKQRSCLRSRSFSVDSTALASLQSSSTKPSVSFDLRVFVHEYEKPPERYAANGWSKWFV